jgi:prepilin-type N-terminal cleavage/methylation domain-containing protein
MERGKRRMNQKGFTLIEIIAVLVILAVMAAIAVPKYLNMQTTAANNAASGALAAGASNVSMVYANMLLNGTANITGATLATALSTANYQNLGDYSATYTAMANTTVGVTVNVTAPTGVTQPAAANTTKNVVLVP